MSSSPEIQNLQRFLDASVTPFHVVEQIRSQLEELRCVILDEGTDWSLEPSQLYAVVRGGSSIIVFKTPTRFTSDSKLHLVGAHTDSPTIKVKPNASIFREGYHLLNVEVYGSPILSSWVDRDLGFAGQLIFRRKGEKVLHTRLVRSSTILRIPSLAIHLQDPEKDSSRLNPQTHLMPVLGLGGGDTYFRHYLESHLELGEDLLDWDLQFFDQSKSSLAGMNQEFIVSSRLDNLCMVHASLRALLDSPIHPTHVTGVVFFHNEEVGSQSWQGAESMFASNVFERVFASFDVSRTTYLSILSKSFLISADMAHAVHPCYEERHDPTHRPRINAGPVLKVNSQKRYATEAWTASRFRDLCRHAAIDMQTFVSRNDVRCGSTIGPALSSLMSIPAVDIGNPMLSMHSIREMAGSDDHDAMIRVFKTFFTLEN